MGRDPVSYAFGDSEQAALRLALVADTFAEPSRAFLREERGATGAPPPGLAVDLGCGPGYTTRLLAECLRCARTVGIDASEAHVVRARRDADPGCEFVCADVLALPWPTGAADRVYARFLLSHLPEPEAAVAAFAGQLRPGGRLLLDEVEAIHTEDPIFRRYLDHVEDVLGARGQCLYVGPRLDACAPGGASSRVRRHEVDPQRAAALFALNWATLRSDPHVARAVGAGERDSLGRQLASLRNGAAPAKRIVWELRQVTIGAGE